MISKRGYKIWCKELMENPLGEYREFTLTESLHGDIPTGVMKFTLVDKKGALESLDNINIMIQSSNVGNQFQLKMKGHIYNITSDNMYVYYHIMMCDKDFITKNRMRKLGKSMESVVRALHRSIKTDVKSNVNAHDFQQKNKTDYNYLLEILPSYNKDIVWGFSSEGLLIKKVTDSDKYPNYNHAFSGTPSEPYSVTKSKHKELPQPSLTRFTYFTSSYYNNQLTYVDKEDEPYEDNRQSNIKYQMKPDLVTTIPYSEFPPYEIGDIVKLEKKYMVMSRQMVLNESINLLMTYGTYW